MGSVTVLTPPGRGAVATLRIVGLAPVDQATALFDAANGRRLADQPVDRASFGRWGIDSSEEVVACRIDSDAVELHCHGGDAAVSRIVADLQSRGYHRRSALKELKATSVGDDVVADESFIEHECRSAFCRATTLRTADILWQQCESRLANAILQCDSFPPDEAQTRIANILKWSDFGLHLTQPWRVVLCGRPNVGKSSLINALVGFGRSIVFDQPGTTRDVVSVETALDGWPIELSDTAGLRDGTDELESAGIHRARQRLTAADLRILLIDCSQPPCAEDHMLLQEWPDALVVAHKSDLPNAWDHAPPRNSIPVSSITGSGINELASTIVQRLVPEMPPPLTPVPVTLRQVEQLTRNHR